MAASLLKGTAYVTGAASGIGKATSFALAKYGITRLTLTDISQQNLATTSNAIKEKYPNVEIEAVQLDVCDGKAVEQSIAETVRKFGRIDVGINIAGIGGAGKATHEMDESEWMKVLDVNLNGVWRSQRSLATAMMKQENLGIREGRGSIINVASMYGLIASPVYIPATPYTASKHGVIGLTRSDAIVYAPHGIRINAICPGYVNTPLLREACDSGAMDPEIAKTPLGRLADVEEIADSIVFLASPLASFMVGSSLLVDGGYTAN